MNRGGIYLILLILGFVLAACDGTKETLPGGTAQSSAQTQPASGSDHAPAHPSPAAANPSARAPGAQLTSGPLECDEPQTPLGAVPPAQATWCAPTETGNPTFISGANSWVDDFDDGSMNAEIGPGYQLFDTPRDPDSYYRARHFRHQNHWMVDIAPYQPSGVKPPYGGGFVFLRPDRSFTFEGDRLVVEADVAAGIQEYGGGAWVEVVISTAPAPTYSIDDLYAMGQFGGAWAFGCRLEQERYPICDLKNNQPNTPADDHASQSYQISPSSSPPGATVRGGYPQPAWRTCAGKDPDLNCRDRFRLELTRTSFTLFVNGTQYFTATNLPPLPEAMTQGPLYVYFAESLLGGIDAEVVRFHWDRIAVNP